MFSRKVSQRWMDGVDEQSLFAEITDEERKRKKLITAQRRRLYFKADVEGGDFHPLQ